MFSENYLYLCLDYFTVGAYCIKELQKFHGNGVKTFAFGDHIFKSMPKFHFLCMDMHFYTKTYLSFTSVFTIKLWCPLYNLDYFPTKRIHSYLYRKPSEIYLFIYLCKSSLIFFSFIDFHYRKWTYGDLEISCNLLIFESSRRTRKSSFVVCLLCRGTE